jgi:ATP-binding cassette subfamily B protein
MKNILSIIKIAKPLYSLIGIICGLIVSAAILDQVAPILSKFIVDNIVAQLQHKGGSTQQLATLIGIAFAMNLLSLVLMTISDRLGDHFAGRLRQFLTERFYDKVLTLPQSYFDSEISGKIVNQLNRGIMSIQNFINSATNFIIPTFLQSIFTIGILAYYNLPIAIFTFLLFPIYLTLSYYSSKRWGEQEVKKNVFEDSTRGRIQEAISNMTLVKSFNNEKNEYEFVSKNLTHINKIYAKQSQTYHIFDFFRGLSLNIVLLIVNIVAFYNTFQGQLTLGELVLILQLINQARRPLFAMSFILTQVQNAESGSKEFFEILTLPSKEMYRIDTQSHTVQNPSIRFDNVSFEYEKSDRVLHNVSFDLQSKQKIALVGHSGAGKSTIVNLILKLYEPTHGDIYLNDTPYKELSHTFVRHNISLVFQENELFSSTIRENVAYGNTKATDTEIINALKAANALNFVMKFPKGLESEVGERGVRLSGGQKQRIQIARALLKNTPILILDEATSSLDSQSEKEVQDALERLMKDKLVIIIAHRFSTIQNVDRILVIDEGKIVDDGKPQHLSKKKGIYSDLLHYQIEGNKKLLEKFEIY